MKISGTLIGQVRKKDPVLPELVPIEQEGEQDVAPEAADGTTVVVVQPNVDPEDAPPDWSKCKASNSSFPADARANWDLWCVSTCSQSPANCARPELTGAAACVCK